MYFTFRFEESENKLIKDTKNIKYFSQVLLIHSTYQRIKD
jgi:hypothetical protein